MYAAEYSYNPEVISVLVAVEADGSVIDTAGKSAFDYANDNAHQCSKRNASRVPSLVRFRHLSHDHFSYQSFFPVV